MRLRRGVVTALLWATIASGMVPSSALGAPEDGKEFSVQSYSCYTSATLARVSSTSAGSQGYQSCTGDIVLQTQRIELWRCGYVVYNECHAPLVVRSVATCNKWGAGSFWCPGSGGVTTGLTAGAYMTADFGYVKTAGGLSGTGFDTSNILYLP